MALASSAITSDEVVAAIAELTDARNIHAQWAAHLRGDPAAAAMPDPRAQEDVVGGPDWHDMWVARYDRVLRVLGELVTPERAN